MPLVGKTRSKSGRPPMIRTISSIKNPMVVLKHPSGIILFEEHPRERKQPNPIYLYLEYDDF